MDNFNIDDKFKKLQEFTGSINQDKFGNETDKNNKNVISKIFDFFDKNHNGILDDEELKDIFSAVQNADKNGNSIFETNETEDFLSIYFNKNPELKKEVNPDILGNFLRKTVTLAQTDTQLSPAELLRKNYIIDVKELNDYQEKIENSTITVQDIEEMFADTFLILFSENKENITKLLKSKGLYVAILNKQTEIAESNECYNVVIPKNLQDFENNNKNIINTLVNNKGKKEEKINLALNDKGQIDADYYKNKGSESIDDNSIKDYYDNILAKAARVMKSEEYREFQSTIENLTNQNKSPETLIEITKILKQRIQDSNSEKMTAKKCLITTCNNKINAEFYKKYGMDAISDKNIVQYFLQENKLTDTNENKLELLTNNDIEKTKEVLNDMLAATAQLLPKDEYEEIFNKITNSELIKNINELEKNINKEIEKIEEIDKQIEEFENLLENNIVKKDYKYEPIKKETSKQTISKLIVQKTEQVCSLMQNLASYIQGTQKNEPIIPSEKPLVRTCDKEINFSYYAQYIDDMEGKYAEIFNPDEPVHPKRANNNRLKYLFCPDPNKLLDIDDKKESQIKEIGNSLLEQAKNSPFLTQEEFENIKKQIETAYIYMMATALGRDNAAKNGCCSPELLKAMTNPIGTLNECFGVLAGKIQKGKQIEEKLKTIETSTDRSTQIKEIKELYHIYFENVKNYENNNQDINIKRTGKAYNDILSYMEKNCDQMSEEQFRIFKELLLPNYDENGKLLKCTNSLEQNYTKISAFWMKYHENRGIIPDELYKKLKINLGIPTPEAQACATDTIVQNQKHALDKEGNYSDNAGAIRHGYDEFLEFIEGKFTFKNSDKIGNDTNVKIVELLKCKDNPEEFSKKFHELTGRIYNPALIKKFQTAAQNYEIYLNKKGIYEFLAETQDKIKKPKIDDVKTLPGAGIKTIRIEYTDKEKADILLEALSKILGKTPEQIKKEYAAKDTEELIQKAQEDIEKIKEILKPSQEEEQALKKQYEDAKSQAIGTNALSERIDKMISTHNKIDFAADMAIIIIASIATAGASNAFLASSMCANMSVAQAKMAMFALRQIPNAAMAFKEILNQYGTTDGITSEDWGNIIKQTFIRGIFGTIGHNTGEIGNYLHQTCNWSLFGAKVTEYAIDAAICTSVDYLLGLQDNTLNETFLLEFSQNIKSMILGTISGKLQNQLVGKSADEQIKLIYAALEDASILDKNCSQPVKDYIENVFKPKLLEKIYKQKIIEENRINSSQDRININENATTELPKDGSWMVYSNQHARQRDASDNNCVIDVLLKSNLDDKIFIRKNGQKIEIKINDKIVSIDAEDIDGFTGKDNRFDYKQQQQAIELAARQILGVGKNVPLDATEVATKVFGKKYGVHIALDNTQNEDTLGTTLKTIKEEAGGLLTLIGKADDIERLFNTGKTNSDENHALKIKSIKQNQDGKWIVVCYDTANSRNIREIPLAVLMNKGFVVAGGADEAEIKLSGGEKIAVNDGKNRINAGGKTSVQINIEDLRQEILVKKIVATSTEQLKELSEILEIIDKTKDNNKLLLCQKAIRESNSLNALKQIIENIDKGRIKDLSFDDIKNSGMSLNRINENLYRLLKLPGITTIKPGALLNPELPEIIIKLRRIGIKFTDENLSKYFTRPDKEKGYIKLSEVNNCISEFNNLAKKFNAQRTNSTLINPNHIIKSLNPEFLIHFIKNNSDINTLFLLLTKDYKGSFNKSDINTSAYEIITLRHGITNQGYTYKNILDKMKNGVSAIDPNSGIPVNIKLISSDSLRKIRLISQKQLEGFYDAMKKFTTNPNGQPGNKLLTLNSNEIKKFPNDIQKIIQDNPGIEVYECKLDPQIILPGNQGAARLIGFKYPGTNEIVYTHFAPHGLHSNYIIHGQYIITPLPQL